MVVLIDTDRFTITSNAVVRLQNSFEKLYDFRSVKVKSNKYGFDDNHSIIDYKTMCWLSCTNLVLFYQSILYN